jgi:predicted MPP superfamily phosphohydrolase
MKPFSLRRLLFDRLVFNLALLLGASQALLWHWLQVVVGGAAPGLLPTVLLTAALVTANALLVPRLRENRARPGLGGALARTYVDLGVGTLLVGMAIAACWGALALAAGLLGAFGASPDAAKLGFRAGSVVFVGGTMLLVLTGLTVGQARVERTHLRPRLPGLAPELEGLRVVQVSDLHIGNRLDGPSLTRMVARINATEPDVLVLTGDLFDHDPEPVEDGARRLADLRARHGVYAVLGNHDHYVGTGHVLEAMARHAPHIRVLRDEIVRLPLPAPLYLAGADDPGADWSAPRPHLPGLDALAGARPQDGPVILLVHRPQAFPQAASLGFPLVLAGHTHGGQLAVPGFARRYNLASVVTRYTRGLYRINGSTLYVNRGLGVGGPRLRIQCPREIATLELAADPAPAGSLH